MGYSNEEVLGVSRSRIPNGLLGHGFTPCTFAEIEALLIDNAEFKPRRTIETDATFKQFIPYCAIRSGLEIMCLRRLCAQGEVRLHNKFSIGIGGHINKIDGAGAGVVWQGLKRELTEELDIDSSRVMDARFVGIINDDSNAVGEVHLALCFVLDVGAARPHVSEQSHMTADWIELPEVLRKDESLETWSRIFAGHLFKEM